MRIKIYLFTFLLFFTTWNALQARSIPGDSLLWNFFKDKQIPLTINNKITLLETGKEKFTDLFAAIDTAKHHIHMEYFNFRNDSIGKVLFQHLAHKAAEGVEVRLMFDAFGNFSNNQPLKKSHLKAIREQGIEIVQFDPLTFPYINHAYHRDHRKIVVIDGQIGYTGGMNVADYYINGLPDIGEWHDLHMRIEGGAVAELQKLFLEMWNKETHQEVKGELYFPTPTDSLHMGKDSIYIVARAPHRLSKRIRKAYGKAIDGAKESIQIVNAYFLPTATIRKSLKKACERGVNVEIMFSERSDVPMTAEGCAYISQTLMKRGANVYLFQKGFVHSKVMIVDGKFCTVGSANLDSRSLCYDYEINAFILGSEATKSLSKQYEQDKQHCVVLNDTYWKNRSFWKKFVGWMARNLVAFM